MKKSISFCNQVQIVISLYAAILKSAIQFVKSARPCNKCPADIIISYTEFDWWLAAGDYKKQSASSDRYVRLWCTQKKDGLQQNKTKKSMCTDLPSRRRRTESEESRQRMSWAAHVRLKMADNLGWRERTRKTTEKIRAKFHFNLIIEVL